MGIKAISALSLFIKFNLGAIHSKRPGFFSVERRMQQPVHGRAFAEVTALSTAAREETSAPIIEY